MKITSTIPIRLTQLCMIVLLVAVGIYAAMPEAVQVWYRALRNQYVADEQFVYSKLCDRAGRMRNALFSPYDGIKEVLLALIRLERSRILMASYVITDKDIAQALIDARGRGVVVEVIACRSGADERWSKIPVIIAAGIPVYVYPAEFTRSIMHHKFVIFSAIAGRPLVMTGSFNMTKSAANLNCENAVFFDNRGPTSEIDLPACYAREFDRVKRKSVRVKSMSEVRDHYRTADYQDELDVVYG